MNKIIFNNLQRVETTRNKEKAFTFVSQGDKGSCWELRCRSNEEEE